eukprot:47359-Prymnesium_polylepis.1
MTRLQVQARSLGFPDLGRKRLWVVRPRLGVQVDEHAVACAHVVPRLNVGELQQAWPNAVQLLGELSRSRVVWAAVHADGEVALGQLEAGRALQVDVALLVGQQPPAHEHHRVVLGKGVMRDHSSGRLLKSASQISAPVGVLTSATSPVAGPLGELLLKLPLGHPLVGHNLRDHRRGEHAVHLDVGQQQRDLLVAHDRAGQLLDVVDILKVDGHRKDATMQREWSTSLVPEPVA